MPDGAFLPDHKSHASGTGSGKESKYIKELYQELLSPCCCRLLCVSPVAMVTEWRGGRLGAERGPLGPIGKVLGAGLEVIS